MTAYRDVPQPETKPGIASAEDGVVVLDGPNGLAVTMTAEAATGTGQSLIAAAQTAELQIGEKGETDA
ncbi:MAG: hypothetical protein P0Y56_15405 [Candidatus Andeanibacterium colombiense]|uniref:Uncharacterized protein n=1 Tax=Candidatus Andeanibacterium colombiense TaxID=3121345 RepID=A0AAJ5X5L8_9SPHN|nr:MAG: hypothetical protein P0Y56_15405 [Sphingomonadaceae bacterium]